MRGGTVEVDAVVEAEWVGEVDFGVSVEGSAVADLGL